MSECVHLCACMCETVIVFIGQCTSMSMHERVHVCIAESAHTSIVVYVHLTPKS